jgi:hypothetical protein
MEPCGTSGFVSLVVDVSPSTEVLNFLLEIKELSFITPVQNINLDNFNRVNP